MKLSSKYEKIFFYGTAHKKMDDQMCNEYQKNYFTRISEKNLEMWHEIAKFKQKVSEVLWHIFIFALR